MVAPGAWKWPAGIVPSARTGLGPLPGASGAEVVAAAGVTEAAIRRWCRLPPSAGGGAAG
jgi:hypothetical protein